MDGFEHAYMHANNMTGYESSEGMNEGIEHSTKVDTVGGRMNEWRMQWKSSWQGEKGCCVLIVSRNNCDNWC